MAPSRTPPDRGTTRSSGDPDRDVPPVSVFLTVRDEELHLADALAQVLAQDYEGTFEVVLAVGPSRDRTREIADAVAARDPRLRVVENPSGLTPSGLNIAIAHARHGLLVRVDGHSEVAPDYLRRVVGVLQATGAANVGGRMVPVGRTHFEAAVAWAMSSPLGIGAASFHTGGAAGPAPTVYLGAFRRDALDRIGGYDEHFVRAQDWELNHRLREVGEVVWFDPEIAVTYRPRGDVRALARQFFRTGQWRRQVVRRYPQTAGLRYLAAPAAVVGMAAGTVAAAVGAAAGPRWLLAGVAVPVGYVCAVVVGAVVTSRGIDRAVRVRLPGVIATMHVAWGAGFLRGVGRGTGSPASVVAYPGPAASSRPAESSAADEGTDREPAKD